MVYLRMNKWWNQLQMQYEESCAYFVHINENLQFTIEMMIFSVLANA